MNNPTGKYIGRNAIDVALLDKLIINTPTPIPEFKPLPDHISTVTTRTRTDQDGNKYQVEIHWHKIKENSNVRANRTMQCEIAGGINQENQSGRKEAGGEQIASCDQST